MTDLVKLYNPANAAALTPEQLQGLQRLTSVEIKELAAAYPNVTMQRAYLLIIDSKSKLPVERQLPNLSSFENLWNLREKNGLRNYVAYGFKGYKVVAAKVARGRKSEVLDLSDTELLTLPGFKINGQDETVMVTKIKKKQDKFDELRAEAEKGASILNKNP